jgi:tetratricopeptide (TPR) repeat protein
MSSAVTRTLDKSGSGPMDAARDADPRAAPTEDAIAADGDSLEEVSEEVSGYLNGRRLDEKALDVLDLRVSEHPDSAGAYSQRGIYYLGAGRYEEALADFREYERLVEKNEREGDMVRWTEELIASIENPMCMPDYILERFAGDYGARHVLLRDHRIYYHRDGGEEYLLSAMDDDTFRLEGLDYLRLRFIAEDEEEPATRVVGLYMSGHRDESLRDPPAIRE